MATTQINVDYSRDKYLTDFGRATLDDRYLLPEEKYQDLFARVSTFYGDDQAHAEQSERAGAITEEDRPENRAGHDGQVADPPDARGLFERVGPSHGELCKAGQDPGRPHEEQVTDRGDSKVEQRNGAGHEGCEERKMKRDGFGALGFSSRSQQHHRNRRSQRSAGSGGVGRERAWTGRDEGCA